MEFVKESTEAKKVTVEEYKVTLTFRVDEDGTVLDSQEFTEQELRDLLADLHTPKVEEEVETSTTEYAGVY